MTKIAELLGLKPDATEAQILKALHVRAIDVERSEYDKLLADYKSAADMLEKLRALPKQNTANVNPEALASKIAAGLDKDKALEVLANQAEHDKTKPHDPLPKAAN